MRSALAIVGLSVAVLGCQASTDVAATGREQAAAAKPPTPTFPGAAQSAKQVFDSSKAWEHLSQMGAIGPASGQPDDQVDHRHRTIRRLTHERLFLNGESHCGQLPGDVRARLADLRRSCRSRPDGDHLLQVVPGLCAIERSRGGCRGWRLSGRRLWRDGGGGRLRRIGDIDASGDAPHDGRDERNQGHPADPAFHEPLTFARRGRRSRAAPRRDRPAGAAQSSDPDRAATLPTARASRRCAARQRAR